MIKKTKLIFEYPEKLSPVIDYKGRYILLKGGRSSGKSHFVARKLLIDRLTKKRDLLCVREFQANLEQSNYKLFKNLIELYGLPYRIRADRFISLRTGAEIVFEGMNDLTADNVKSYEGFHDAWIEEGQNFSLGSFQKLDPTIRQSDSQIFVTMNPETKDDAVSKEIENNFKDNSLIIHINYNDNPFCPQNIIDMADAYKINKPKDYEHIWLGYPKDMADNTVTKYFTDDNVKNLKYLKDADLYLSCDFNTSAPMSWAIAHKDENKVYFIDEIVLENADTREATEEFIRRYGRHEGIITICGDASGDYLQAGSKKSNYNMLETLLTQAKLKWRKRIRPKNPEIIHRVEAWNNRVLTTFGERCLYISPKCKWLLHNVYNLLWKEGCEGKFNLPTSTQIRNNPELNFLGHIFDAASYLVEIEFPVVKHKMDKIISKQNFIDKSKGWTSL